MSDFTDIKKVSERLRNANNALHEIVPEVAKARQIKEFASDRRKALLARCTAPFLEAGDSVASAEAKARANDSYKTELEILAAQYQFAEHTLAKYSALQATFDAARSLLSMSKETFKQLQG